MVGTRHCEMLKGGTITERSFACLHVSFF